MQSAASARTGRRDDATAVILRALELGVSWLDTAADGAAFDCERLIGQTLRGMFQKPTVVTRLGPLGTIPAYARRTLEGQLERLGATAVNLWILRGFIEEQCSVTDTMLIVRAMVDEGKVRHVGLANCTADQLRRAHAVHQISAVEVEWSLIARHGEAELIPAARQLGVGIIAVSPLGGGALAGRWQTLDEVPVHYRRRRTAGLSDDSFERITSMVASLAPLAESNFCTVAQLALAWLHKQGPDVFPVPRTASRRHLEENAGALAVSRRLTASDLEQMEALSADAAPTDTSGNGSRPG